MAINNLIVSGGNNNNGGNPKGPGKPGNGKGTPIKPTNISQASQSGVPDELVDYNQLAKDGEFHPVQFRDHELTQMLSVLNTLNHPNVLLTGDAGVGKTALAKQLALDLVAKDDNLTKQVLGKDTVIYALPITNLIAGGSLVGQIEERIKNILEFAENAENHAILYIDEIHQLFDSHSSTTQSIAQQLKPALADPNLHVIASTTKGESNTLKKDPAFRRRFSEILLPELTDEQTKTVLKLLVPRLEKHHDVEIKPDQFDYLMEKANEYAPLANSHRPDSAITLLDRAASDTHVRALKIAPQFNNNVQTLPVTYLAIDSAAKHLINLGKNAEPQKADDLKANLDANVISQDSAKEKLVNLINRQQLHLTKPTKPDSFLFAGPTGTGKTEMVKQLTDSLYGNRQALITLNMTEYAEDATVSRLIGSPRGYVGYESNQPLPFDALTTNPYHIILLDEFEKAAPAVKRLFMQILDEGSLDDNRGAHLDFKHCLIIATTNAGAAAYEEQQNSIGFSDDKDADEVSKSDVLRALRTSFPIELLNRFNDIVLFKALNKDDYKQVLKVHYNKFIKEITDYQTNLNLTPTKLDMDTDYDFIDKLSKFSYNPMLNGRPAVRTVKEYVENMILKQQHEATIDLTKYELVFPDKDAKVKSGKATKSVKNTAKNEE